ncbi:MAG: DUF5717 family protein [Defluviitaleaceae bacterium]|nr:DUF5717 family protein [Defluviitaleaceae bacterium]
MTQNDYYEKKPTKFNSCKNYMYLSLKAYKCYKLSGEQRELLHAAEIAKEGSKFYPSCIQLFLLCAFFNTELGDTEDAKNIIDRVKPYLNYYKNNNTDVYIAYIYLSALYDIKTDANNLVSKQIKLLEKQHCAFSKLLLGHIYYEVGNYPLSIKFLEESCKKGGRSFFLYLLYSKICGKANDSDKGILFLPFIKWGLKEGLIDTGFIEECEDLIKKIFSNQVEAFKALYESTGSELLLRLICEGQVAEGDISKESYKYYKEAENRQLYIDGVPSIIIKCACIHEYEDIVSHTMRSFLKNNQMDEETLPFVLHLILTNPNFDGFIEEFGLKDLILKASEWAIENSLNGRIYNSIYRYCLENFTESSDKIASLIYKDLFIANIYVDDVDTGLLYVHEDELLNMKVYEFEGNFKQIRTVAGNLRIDIIDKNTGRIADVSYTIKKQVENADARLYKYYINRGYNEPALYIALSSFYIKMGEPSEEYIEILQKTLERRILSQNYRMQVGGELGNTLYALNRQDKALEYFNRVDENRLDPKYIETMLIAFVNAFDFKKVIALIIKKREYISDRTLLWAIKELLADYRNNNSHKLIADAAYELLIKNWYDVRLLDVVGKYYAGSNEDWYVLRDSLAKIDLYNLALDKKILENSLVIRDFSEASQIVFNRLYQNDKEKELTSDYIYYACYEIIAEGKKPSYEFILNLENHFELSCSDIDIDIDIDERVFAYALSTTYLKFSIKTFKSHEILQKSINFMETDGILLPEFKDAKDINAAYIEKNWPFYYKAIPSDKVFLYYKIDEAAEYNKKPMNHLFFGIFYTVIPIFYNEKVEYYICRETEAETFETETMVIFNNCENIKIQPDDMFFDINNALIYEKMFKHTEVEKIILKIIGKAPEVKGQLI